MATRRPGLRRLLVLLVTIPFWTNLLIRIYCWVLLLRDEGLVNQTLQALHLTSAPITFLYSDGAILMGLVYANLPFMALPIYAALEKLDPRLVEAGYDLYAGRWAILSRRIVWPLARPGVLAGHDAGVGPYHRVVPRPGHSGWRPPSDDRQPDPATILDRARLVVRRGAVDDPDGAGAGLDDARRLAPCRPPGNADVSAKRAARILPRNAGEGDHAKHGGGGCRSLDLRDRIGGSTAKGLKRRLPPPSPAAVPLPRLRQGRMRHP